MNTERLSKAVLEELVCPLCLEYMLPPITLCDNGHSICGSCKSKLQKCPTCKAPLSEIRNKALEKLASNVECSCHNKIHGCKLTFPLVLISDHQKVCKFSPIECPLNVNNECSWAGPLMGIRNHVINEHTENVKCITKMSKRTVNNFNKKLLHVDILLTSDDLFFEVYEVIGDAFYYIIQYIGPEEEASKFKYKFVTASGAEEITMCCVVSSYNVDVQKVYGTCKCVKLFYDTLECFLNEEGNLNYHVEISKVQKAHK